jgi:hypothetical protein
VTTGETAPDRSFDGSDDEHHEVRRNRIALAAALVALALAALGAVLPSNRQSSTVRWPAAGAEPVAGELAGTTLLLARHHAAELTIGLPCAIAVPPGGMDVVATARRPSEVGGLLVRAEGTALAIEVGPVRLAEVPDWIDGEPCDGALRFSGADWALTRGASTVATGRAEDPPEISALRAPGDLLAGEARVTVEIVTETHGTTPTLAQHVLRLGAWVAAAIALTVLLAPLVRKRRRPLISRPWLTASDAAVAGFLALWAVVGPVLLDDGWVIQSSEQRSGAGVFPSYHNAWDAWVPLGFLHNSLYMVVSSVSRQILWVRVPAVIALLIAWRILRVNVPLPGPRYRLVVMTMAVSFCSCAGAWMITARPEPLVATLAAIALVSALRYVDRRESEWLVIGAVSACFSIGLHPSGPIAAAPLIVLAPAVMRDLRERRTTWQPLLAGGAISSSLLALTLFADSDLRAWSINRGVFASAGVHQSDWRDELHRYSLLFENQWDNALRRSVVFIALVAIVLLLTQVAGRRSESSAVISWSLPVAMALLVFTPSKWPWHFGSVGVFIAAALANEVQQLVRAKDPGRYIRCWVALTGCAVTATVAWRASERWEHLALMDSASDAWESVSRWMSSPAIWIAVFVLGAAYARRREGTWHNSLIAVSGAAPLIVIAPVLGVATSRFVSDGLAAPDWSILKQNARSLVGRDGCGLGSVLMVADPQDGAPAPRSPFATPADAGVPSEVLDIGALAPAEPGAFPRGRQRTWPGDAMGTWLGDDGAVGWFATPWVDVPPGRQSLFIGVAGRIGRDGNQVMLQDASVTPEGLVVGDTRETDIEHDSEDWKLVEIERFSGAEPTAVRLIVVDGSRGFRGWLSVSDVLVSPAQPLDALVRGKHLTTLLSPFQRLYFPCIDEPPLTHGVAEVPELVVGDIPLVPQSAPGLVGDVLGIAEHAGYVGDDAVLTLFRVLPGPPWVEVPWELAP